MARHSHGAQVFTAWASVKLQGVATNDVTINGYPLFHVAGVLPTSLTALSAGMETVMPTPALMRNREVIANYWRCRFLPRGQSKQRRPEYAVDTAGKWNDYRFCGAKVYTYIDH